MTTKKETPNDEVMMDGWNVTTKKETTEVTKKEDNNENGIESLFRIITTIASETFLLLFKVSYDQLPFFVTAT